MADIKRGLRNIWRNRTRSLMVMLLLGISCALALTMITAGGSLDSEIARVEAGVGTLIEIAAPGSAGGMLTMDTPLDETILANVLETPGIASAHPLALIALSRRGIGGGFQMPTPETRAAPRLVLGVEPGGELFILGGGIVEVVLGRNLEPADDGQAVVLISQEYAQVSGSAVGSQVMLDEREFTVVGMFVSEQAVGNRSAFVPLATVQGLYGLEGHLTHIYAFADTIHDVDSAKASLIAALNDAAEVSAQKDAMAGQLDSSLSGIKSAIRTTLVLALAVAAIVVFAVMMMAVRERATEIGVLKAIGAARSNVVLQFAAESTALALAGAAVGVAGFLAGGRLLGMSILERVAGTAVTHGVGRGLESIPGSGGGMWSGGWPAAGIGGSGLGISLGGLDAVLTWQSVILIAGLACALGLFGGLLPAMYAASLKPAEVLRRG